MKFTPIAAALGGSLGEEIAGAFRDLYSLYPASLTDWFASLYDPEIGGFYFSCPARDTEGFLPDAENRNDMESIPAGPRRAGDRTMSKTA